MIADWIIASYLIGLFVLANLPFINQRLFLVIPVTEPGRQKSFWWRIVEWLVYFVVGMGAGLYLEYSIGGIEPKGWEFWAVSAAIFAVFSVIGFIWQYQLRKYLQV
ncbi:MAG: DUF2818 family protein [Halomonas sp.]|uniref:DUF2818 family protein n=1 Tax=Halomonas sp. TaxID=1486246 RepID=UPI003970F6BE